jgi:hypothetical protein
LVPRFTNFVNSVVTNFARSIGRAALCFFCNEHTSKPTSSLDTIGVVCAFTMLAEASITAATAINWVR